MMQSSWQLGVTGRLAGWLGGGFRERSWLIFLAEILLFYVYIYHYIYIYLVAPEESWVGFFSPKIVLKPIEDFLLL